MSYRLLILQGEHQPTTQQTATHRRHRTVDDVEQRTPIVLHGLHQFQGTDGELVKTHILFFLDARNGGDMTYLRVLRYFQILQDGTSSHKSAAQMIHAEAFHCLHLEVFQQLLIGCLFRKHPVIELEGDKTRAEVTLKVTLTLTVEEHLLGLETAQQLLHIIVGTLANQVFACRDVEERYATGRASEVDGSQEVVLLVVEYVV